MKRVCAYCNAVMSPGDSPDSPDSPVTHGICDSCSRHFLSQLGVDISKYLDMLNAPVIFVNPDGQVLDANSDAVCFMGKPLDKILDTLTGNALGCSHAGLPEGCGKTAFCSGCAIRNSVQKTYETGEPVEQCPAVLQQGTPDHSCPINLLVSTRKAGPVIMLRVEPVDAEGTIPPVE
ncbi:MAG: hypothetical protein WC593_07140 [Methanoregula sp.]